MSTGYSILLCKSAKQKINVKNYTEADLVGICDYLPYKIVAVIFMEGQGYTVDRKMRYQENQRAIKMEKSGMNSCTRNSKHIHIKNFFAKDQVDKGHINVECCLTGFMLEFFTKPL